MSDGHEDKTEQASEKRLQEARDKGQFARSQELGVATSLLVAGVTAAACAESQARQLAQIATNIFSHLGQYEVRVEAAGDLSLLAATTMLGLCAPMLGACLVAGVVINGLQSGFRLTPDALELKGERLNPAEGLQRLFSKQGLVKLATDAVKLVVVGVALNGVVRNILGDPIFFTPVDIGHLGGFLYDTAQSLLRRSALGIGVVAALHYLYQKHKIGKDMMMSRQEVKDEHQQSEGDPHVKGQRRAMARRMVQKGMLEAVPTADVIVTNPTHYAVALKYERGRDQAPMVLAKGQNQFAQRIKALGAEHEVPTIENKPVARMLYKHGQPGKPIPAEMFQAVAEILAFVYRTHRYYFFQLKARRAEAEEKRGK